MSSQRTIWIECSSTSSPPVITSIKPYFFLLGHGELHVRVGYPAEKCIRKLDLPARESYRIDRDAGSGHFMYRQLIDEARSFCNLPLPVFGSYVLGNGQYVFNQDIANMIVRKLEQIKIHNHGGTSFGPIGNTIVVRGQCDSSTNNRWWRSRTVELARQHTLFRSANERSCSSGKTLDRVVVGLNLIHGRNLFLSYARSPGLLSPFGKMSKMVLWLPAFYGGGNST